ncbi:MAG: PAS domain-containing sensor histidine kinase [Gammaproteobacteria bacterium]|nr:MAG: PAS domain-containing sensor histidine kinase [Gammaproteobacteria bacterium]
MQANGATSRQEVLALVAEQQRQQAATLLRIYNYYRIVVGIALLVIFVREIGERLLGTQNPDAFLVTVLAYIAINMIIAGMSLLVPSRYFDRPTIGFVIVALDTLALTLLMHFSGGVTSGLGTLIIVSIAAGAILVPGRISTALPAIGTIAVLYEEFYLSLIPTAPPPDFFQAGLLGALYFATSLVIQGLSKRLQRSEAISLQRAAEVASLERLNRLIVQRMRTGIVVFDTAGRPRLVNASARGLLRLGGPKGEDDTESLIVPHILLKAFRAWQADETHRSEPFRTEAGATEVRVNFARLANHPDSEVVTFIEDNTELTQQAQQLKLAALGRLSASIAHEIRNPLGAISHAAQLLQESPALEKADLRLTDIIQTHSKRMNEVIENILELSRRRSPEPRILLMREWLEAFKEHFNEAQEVPVELEIHIDPADAKVRIDPRQMDQVLTNLCVNGARYSEKVTGRRWVALKGGVDSGTERPWLEVLDEGPGVDALQLDNLFEPFYTTEETGTGLGLYISRELCEANQAQLSYLPRQEGGSCFRINFPHPQRQTA